MSRGSRVRLESLLERFEVEEHYEQPAENHSGGVITGSKRKYNFITRQPAIPVNRFAKSKELLVNSCEEMADIISTACRCKSGCFLSFEDTHMTENVRRHRNQLHNLNSLADRRVFLARIISRHPLSGHLAYLSVQVCVNFMLRVLAISSNQLYGVLRRLDNNLPIAATLAKGNHRKTVEIAVSGWLLDLAETHDPQPDKEFTILAFKRKKHVYEEYKRSVRLDLAPSCSLSYFCHVWKKHFRTSIVVRKTMRFALCDECGRIQREREKTSDRTKLAVLRKQEESHLMLVKRERICYAKRIREATSSGNEILSIAMDGADQGTYGLPYFCQVK